MKFSLLLIGSISFINTHAQFTELPIKYINNVTIDCYSIDKMGEFNFHEGLAGIKFRGGKCGFIDKTGKEITPFKYDGVIYFNGGLAIVIENCQVKIIQK